MKIAFARALALVLLSLTLTAPALAASKPKPIPLPTPQLPTKKLHTEFVVEVNAKGQVVRVKSGKDSVDTLYNAHTYGDVLQMWIRHPDGTAVVGLYRVTFDYNPKNHMIARHVSLVKAGGNWGTQQGAALQMMDLANKRAPDPLPGLQQITGKPPAPKHTP
ncbi:MAG TPA: hypothetical protein VIJ12_08105 [Candidatus Baltobacteraceae bacterium]